MFAIPGCFRFEEYLGPVPRISDVYVAVESVTVCRSVLRVGGEAHANGVKRVELIACRIEVDVMGGDLEPKMLNRAVISKAVSDGDAQVREVAAQIVREVVAETISVVHPKPTVM